MLPIIKKSTNGFATILTVVLVLAIVLVLSAETIFIIGNNFKIARNEIASAMAYYIAESGIEDAIYRIIKNKNYTVNYSFPINESQSAITISTSEGKKIIEAQGAIKQIIKKIKVILSEDINAISFHYGAQVGEWGLKLKNNSIINGNVYSNGTITGTGLNSKITGDALVASQAVPDQQWVVQNTDFIFGIFGFVDAAQSFIPSKSGRLLQTSLYLKKIGSPPDQTIRIVSNDNGKPSKTVLAQGTLQSSKVTSNYNWANINFNNPPTLTAGQKYWILIDASSSLFNFWLWGEDDNDNYPDNTGKFTLNWNAQNPTWFDIGGDLDFKTWMEGDIHLIEDARVDNDAYANTIKNSSIGRDAYFQTLINTTVSRVQYPNSPDPSPKDLPISYAQIQEWETAAEAGGIINPSDGTYEPNDDSSLGPIKINGNLRFEGNTIVTITGPVWVNGDIYFENAATVKLDNNLINGFPIIADKTSDQNNYGRITFGNNAITQDSQSGGYLLIISTNKSLDEIDPAIFVDNNVNKDNPQSILFGLQGVIKIQNNAKFKEITGYGLVLEENAQVFYDQGLINANFSSGPGGGWIIKEWKII